MSNWVLVGLVCATAACIMVQWWLDAYMRGQEEAERWQKGWKKNGD